MIADEWNALSRSSAYVFSKYALLCDHDAASPVFRLSTGAPHNLWCFTSIETGKVSLWRISDGILGEFDTYDEAKTVGLAMRAMGRFG